MPNVLETIVGSSTFLSALFGHHSEQVADAELAERRQTVVRCSGCKAWSPETVYLSNGGHYCLLCAQIVHRWSRAKPIGRRERDITLLADAEAPAKR